ncbi:MAG: hypothetical protein ACNA8K_04380 [Cyclonatronaceae bacterium]
MSDNPRIFVQQKTNSLPATGIFHIPYKRSNNTAQLATTTQKVFADHHSNHQASFFKVINNFSDYQVTGKTDI